MGCTLQVVSHTFNAFPLGIKNKSVELGARLLKNDSQCYQSVVAPFMGLKSPDKSGNYILGITLSNWKSSFLLLINSLGAWNVRRIGFHSIPDSGF